MRKTFLDRSSDVVVAALLLWFASSWQSTISKAPNPPTFGLEVSPLRYLNYYNSFRNAGLVRLNTLSNFRIAQQTAKLRQTLFRMDSELYRRGALAERDYQRSLLQRNLSAAQEQQLDQRSAILETTKKLNDLQADMIKGASIDSKKLYDAYVEQWNGECLLFKKNVEFAKAQLAWDLYVLKKDERLVSRNYIAHAEYLEHQRNVFAAKDDLATQQYLDSICLHKIPTYEEVRRISPPH